MFSAENMEIWIKCPHCGSRYIVPEKDKAQENIEYTCTNCKQTIPVEYFGYCPTCKYVTGQTPEIDTMADGLLNIGKGAIRGLLNPAYGLSALSSLVDNIPFAKHSGRCHFCNKLYVECPECHKLKRITADCDALDVLTCEKCGARFRRP